MDDLEFVQTLVKGDKRTWDEFVDKYSRLIYNYLYSVLKNRSTRQFNQDNINDLFQEFFVNLSKDNFKKLRTFKARNGCSLASWLRSVVINFTIDYLRKSKILISLDAQNDDESSLKDMLSDGSPAITDTIAREEILVHLKDCIRGLDKNDKYFLELHMNQGLMPEALGKVLGITRSAVDMRKSRIIRRLRECFKGKGLMLDF